MNEMCNIFRTLDAVSTTICKYLWLVSRAFCCCRCC